MTAYVFSEIFDFHPSMLATIKRAALDETPVVLCLLHGAESQSMVRPFSAELRAALVRECLPESINRRLTIVALPWVYGDKERGRQLDCVRAKTDLVPTRAYILKNQAGARGYAELLQGAQLVELDSVPSGEPSALACRTAYFAPMPWRDRMALLREFLEPAAVAILNNLRHAPGWARLRQEYLAISKTRDQYETEPYETADAFIRCQDKVLVVVRAGDVGNGLLAMPGGFRNPGESMRTAALRELEEETSLTLTEADLPNAFGLRTQYAHPLRSARGAVETVVQPVDLGDREPPATSAQDDAGETLWLTKDEVRARWNEFFEDHAAMIAHQMDIHAPWPEVVRR